MDGQPLPAEALRRIEREYDRWHFTHDQVLEVELERRKQLRSGEGRTVDIARIGNAGIFRPLVGSEVRSDAVAGVLGKVVHFRCGHSGRVECWPGLREWRRSSGESGRPVRLLDQVRHELRLRHYSPRTEEAYAGWVRRFVLVHGKRHPIELGREAIGGFLSDLATRGRVSASTQNQALSALLFLYRDVLERRLPVVPSPAAKSSRGVWRQAPLLSLTGWPRERAAARCGGEIRSRLGQLNPLQGADFTPVA